MRWSWPAYGFGVFTALLLCAGLFVLVATDEWPAAEQSEAKSPDAKSNVPSSSQPELENRRPRAHASGEIYFEERVGDADGSPHPTAKTGRLATNGRSDEKGNASRPVVRRTQRKRTAKGPSLRDLASKVKPLHLSFPPNKTVSNQVIGAALGKVVFEFGSHGASASATPNAVARDALNEALHRATRASSGSASALIDSADDAERLRGVGLAVGASEKSPRTSVKDLIAAATNPEGERSRLAAIVALGRFAAKHRNAAEALIALGEDSDAAVRRAAIEQWSHLPADRAIVAVELLASQSVPSELVPVLVQTVFRAGLAPQLLVRDLDATVTARVLPDLLRQPTDRLVAAASAIRVFALRTIETPEGAPRAGELAQVLGRAREHDALLHIVQMDRLPDAARIHALDQLLRNDTARLQGIRAHLILLSQSERTLGRLRSLLARVDPATEREAALFESQLTHLAEHHNSRWVRDQAKAKIAVLRPAPTAPLVIQSAVYGLNGVDIDLASILQSRVRDGRLSVRAWSDFAGDPVYGVNKELRIVYWVKGARKIAVLRDGQTIDLK